jgi:hypothetical protein
VALRFRGVEVALEKKKERKKSGEVIPRIFVRPRELKEPRPRLFLSDSRDQCTSCSYLNEEICGGRNRQCRLDFILVAVIIMVLYFT